MDDTARKLAEALWVALQYVQSVDPIAADFQDDLVNAHNALAEYERGQG